MLTRTGCLKTGPEQKQIIRLQIVLMQNSYSCERLPLEYVKIPVYYNPQTDIRTHTCMKVNAA